MTIQHAKRRLLLTGLYGVGAWALPGCAPGDIQDAAEPATSNDVPAADPTPVQPPPQAAAQTPVAASLARTTASPKGVFVHPGLLHTEEDFRRMAAKVAAGEQPWLAGWQRLIANPHASLAYRPRPQVELWRGNDGVNPDNSARLYRDVAAAYQCALRWKISGDTAYADKAVEILDAWSSTLRRINSVDGASPFHDGFLMAGFQGYQFANAGEIMRTYPGWTREGLTAFQRMMSGLFMPVNRAQLAPDRRNPLLSYANWDLGAMASLLAIGVLCDDRSAFDEAVGYFTSGIGNGAIAQAIYYLHPGHLGQVQESGRDQGHNTLCVATLGALCEMAWNQGVDLYGAENNAVLSGAEYVAKGNLLAASGAYHAVPFTPYLNQRVTQTEFATQGQGTARPTWALIYHHYVNRRGLAAPYSGQFAQRMAPEGGGGDYGQSSGGFDQLGFGTLTHWRDPIAQGAAASGLTARHVEQRVELSWWGSAHADSYTLRRATSPTGPWTVVASGIRDLLTFNDAPPEPRRYWYTVCAVTAGAEGPASQPASVLVGRHLLMQLRFDDRTGTMAADGSGNGRDARLVGGARWTVGPRAGMGAVALDGTTGYVDLPTDLTSELGDCTIATWVMWRATATDACVFWFGRNANRYWRLTPRDAQGVMRFGATVNGFHGEQVVATSEALPRNVWTHLAVTLSGTTATLYVNGNVAAFSSLVTHAPYRVGTAPLNALGRRMDGVRPYLYGDLADFRLYCGALSAPEIAMVYAGR